VAAASARQLSLLSLLLPGGRALKSVWQPFEFTTSAIPRPAISFVIIRFFLVAMACLLMNFVKPDAWFAFADHLIADEFSAELASGAAYVAGHDVDGRPVVVSSELFIVF
jgi:hypothetical protein